MLFDGFGRKIDYLRISVTDRCNLSCFYCRKNGIEGFPRNEILTFEEIEFIVDIFKNEFEIKKLRLTGGEPLMRKGIDSLICRLCSKGLSVNLTTNGILLFKFAKFLAEQGIGVNLSLDTLNHNKFKFITGFDFLDYVLDGLEQFLSNGGNLKINTVVLKGVNDDEIFDLIDFAGKKGVEIRFIEFMPFVGKDVWSSYFVSEDEIKSRIERKGNLVFLGNGSSTARVYLFDNRVRIGFISTVTRPFCDSCSRIRITSDGKIVLCMFDDRGYSLKKFLRPEFDGDALRKFIIDIVKKKPRGFVDLKDKMAKFEMIKLGG
ncbi:GTP 3',8-cyclase MoaA [Candidatus Chrysopegis kryptomonas]|uniref:GTP 3',8-cyclase n=1 Tax=Candidatus Chryseopegocella kryptomonas TaxID=1633643 RepID=A0A0P1MNP7_9BACT|nr:GTP 3',8-cyclase MoaA [Candidatus Chrysopegis kryptomonas]CUS96768.1 cyclic pyranopterin phosphate synthase [Candidatus Chrysopegis kryptomonas]